MSQLLHRCARVVAMVATSGAIVVGAGGIALAVSGGGYSPSDQGCSGSADANDQQGAESGCHNMQILVQDGSGHTYAQAGTDQEAQGENVHAADATVSPDGSAQPTGGDHGSGVTVGADTGYQPFTPDSCGVFDLIFFPINLLTGSGCTFTPTGAPSGAPSVTVSGPSGSGNGSTPDPTSGRVYFGADDNLDTGEHDAPDGKYGSKSSQDGPSDGGAIQLAWHPLDAAGYSDVLAALLTGNAAPLAQDPVRAASLSFGACADGICAETTTTRQTLYNGGGGAGDSRNVYDYSGKQWDPYNCSSGSAQDEQQCGSGGENSWRKSEASNVYAEPGVQVYEDPDPNGSPALPTQLYPLPAAYVGTCGVTVGGGGVTAPASPVTNSAGQVSVDPAGC